MLFKASKRFIFDPMKKKRLKPKRLLCYTITIVQPVLPLLTQNTLGRRTPVRSKESVSSKKAMEMKLLGRVFSNCQLIHSEPAKVLGLTYQLWHKYELQPDNSNHDYLNLHLQAHAVVFHLHFSIFFPWIPHQGYTIPLTQHWGSLFQGKFSNIFFFSSCMCTLKNCPSCSGVQQFKQCHCLCKFFLFFLFSLGTSSNWSVTWFKAYLYWYQLH